MKQMDLPNTYRTSFNHFNHMSLRRWGKWHSRCQYRFPTKQSKKCVISRQSGIFTNLPIETMEESHGEDVHQSKIKIAETELWYKSIHKRSQPLTWSQWEIFSHFHYILLLMVKLYRRIIISNSGGKPLNPAFADLE